MFVKTFVCGLIFSISSIAMAQDLKISTGNEDATREFCDKGNLVDNIGEKVILCEEIERLKRIIESERRPLIRAAVVTELRLTETTATLVVNTGKYGKIAIEATGAGYKEKVVSDELVHVVTFAGLSAGNRYQLEFSAIRNNGTEIPIESSIQEFRTESHGYDQTPNITIQRDAKNITPNSITLDLRSDKKSLVQINCHRVIPGAASESRLVKCANHVYNEIKRTKAGSLLEGQFSDEQQSEFLIDRLEPDTEYEFSGVAVGENGISRKLEFQGTYRTAKAPERTEFDGPISIEIQPEKINVSWRWIHKPKTSSVKLKLNGGFSAGGVDITFPPIPIRDGENSSAAEIPLRTISQALAGINYGQGSRKEKPLFVVAMTGQDGKEVLREFELAFVMPNADKRIKTSVLQAVATAATDVAPEIGDKRLKKFLNLAATILFAF